MFESRGEGGLALDADDTSGELPELGSNELVWEPPDDGPPWSQFWPSAMLMQMLAARPVGEMGADQLIEATAAWGRLIAHSQAMQVRALARFLDMRAREPGGDGGRFAGDEIGPALGIGRHAAAARLGLASALLTRLPRTLAAMEDGLLELAKARILDEVTANISADQAAAVESQLLPQAHTLTPRQLRAAAQRVVLTVDPDGADARHQAARAERRVELRPVEDGMAVLSALLPADKAVAIYRRIDELARAARVEDDPRTADARRADVFTDLLLDGPKDAATVTAQVHVTVPLTALAGADKAPGELAGYGPITAAQARDLAATDATWRRLLTDPVSGALLDYGRRTYRPPTALADFVRARDKTCRFPGCHQPAHKCDLDHTLAFEEGGATCDCNLGPLCRHHHIVKQRPGWHLTQDDHAVFTWTTPTGRRYVTRPEPLGGGGAAGNPRPSHESEPPAESEPPTEHRPEADRPLGELDPPPF
jgi:hypothetical protein